MQFMATITKTAKSFKSARQWDSMFNVAVHKIAYSFAAFKFGWKYCDYEVNI